MNLIAIHNALQRTISAQGMNEFTAKHFVASKLVSHFPSLSVLFDAYVARLMPLHVVLAAELHLLATKYRLMAEWANRLRSGVGADLDDLLPLPLEGRNAADAGRLADGMREIGHHARAAQELLSLLVLDRFTGWNRLRLTQIASAELKPVLLAHAHSIKSSRGKSKD
ncbi:hypothetical protein M0765_000655 [Variovorax sp. S2]|nr:hypothetical protein [Variovorax sp. S12S4]